MLLALVSCAYEAPIDDAVPAADNGITGTVIFSGSGAASTTFVTLYNADNPGPPFGTGAPVTFTSIRAAAFTGTGQGIQGGDFAFTGIADGSYYVNALMDVDGDFSPFATGLAGATCRDLVGSHLADLVSLSPAPVEVRGGELLQNVTVVLGGPLLTERPAFALPQNTTLSKTRLKGSVNPDGTPNPANVQVFRLDAIAVGAAYGPDLVLDLPGPCVSSLPCDDLPNCPCDIDSACETAIPVWMVDADGDGSVDPYPGELQATFGLLNVWPRVYLEHLGDPEQPADTFRFEGKDYDERWVSEAFPLAAELLGGALQGIPPDLVAAGPIGAPFLAKATSVTLAPLFRHYHQGGSTGVDASGPFDVVNLLEPSVSIDDVPSGAWSVTAVGPSGQTWTVPNELGVQELPSTRPDFDPTTQAMTLVFTD